MGTSNEELLKTIRYYQQSLDKYTSFENNYKLLSIIEKLKRLPIATFHLEETGIGRTVNALRKLGGDVGDAAKGLVARWKEMVVQEEVKTKENSADETTEACASENEDDSYEEKENSCREDEKDGRYREKENSSSHKSSNTERTSSEKHDKDKKKYSSNNGSGSSREKLDKHKNKENSSKKRGKESDSSSDEHSSKIPHESSGFESEEEYEKNKHGKSKLKRQNISESSEDEEDEDRKHKSKKSRHSKNSSDSEDSSKKHRSSKSRDYSSSKSKSSDKTEHKKKYDSSSDREVDKSKPKHRSSSKSKRDSDCEESKSRSKHKSMKNNESSSDTEEAKHKPKHDSKSKHEKSKSHTSHSDKHEKKDKKESKKEESKEKHSHKKDESRKHDDKNKKSKDEKENGKKEKSSSSSRPDEGSKRSGSGVKHKSSSEKKKEKIKVPKPANTEKIMNGIDSGSGASFAEALGMCGPMVSKSSSSSSKKKSSSLPTSEKPRNSSSYVRPDKVEVVEEDTVPSLLKEQPPEPLNINISSLLPEITPNYRPVGFPVDNTPKRVLSQDEALSQVISNKNMRTKVYSGNKSYGKVETLFDLCVRILQDNIDALEYTGGVPYLILKPVLEKATPDQLFNMEHHNPYLIEDTDELWLLHCQKEFRNKKREELESWREMYMRCLDEREARLNAITATIKQSQDKSTPIRTTKLAYIDSVVKPPRNIARKQAKNGTAFDKKPSQTPASRVAALSSSGEAGKVAVPNPGSRAVERSSSSNSTAAMKPKKAPLMAKTLSFLKNRFRR